MVYRLTNNTMNISSNGCDKAVVEKPSALKELLDRFDAEVRESEYQINSLEENLHNLHNTKAPTEDTQSPVPSDDFIGQLAYHIGRLRDVRIRLAQANDKLAQLV